LSAQTTPPALRRGVFILWAASVASRKLWAKILLTVAGAVVYLFVMAFVAALSCSASCSGFTTEAALIGWGGFFLATTGLVFLLIWIWNDKPRKNQSNEALTYKEIH